jgi:hypothetical protein
VIVIYLSVAAALVIAGAAAGVLAVVSLGIRREEHLKRASTDRAAQGARQLTGLYTRSPGLASQPTTTGAGPDLRS